VAEAIAERLRRHGSAIVQPVASTPIEEARAVDLIVIGGPTEGHGMTPEVRVWLDALQPGSLSATLAATFDTRLKWPRLLSGSASDDIAGALRAIGTHVVAEESFLVSRKPQLLVGELERAEAWAATLPGLVEARTPALAGTAR
jgi:flavodoxin